MYISHKIALDIDDGQQAYLKKASGTARFAYDWALEEWNRQYDEYKEGKRSKSSDEGILRKQLDEIKSERSPWMREVTKSAPQEAIIDLGKASKRYPAYLESLKTLGMKGKVPRAERPTFKKKGVHDSFSISNDQIRIDGNHLRIPRLGWVWMFESIRSSGPIKTVTISRTADRWFASFTVDTPDLPSRQVKNQDMIGVDLGVIDTVTLASGKKYLGRGLYHRLKGKLSRLHRKLSRQVRYPSNWQKTRGKVARLEASITHVRKNFIDQLTTMLTRNHIILWILTANGQQPDFIQPRLPSPQRSRSMTEYCRSSSRRKWISSVC